MSVATTIEQSNGVLKVGTTFLKYQVTSLLGQGGCAWVYGGYDAFLGRSVAIKVLRPLHEAADLYRRGQAEAKVLSRLRHPNIVEIFDAGVTEGGLLYIVMELLVGRSLLGALRDVGRLTAAEAVPLFIQIAQAIAAAHELGVVHRDIKPENIFVVGNNLPKVLDFGIAKLTDGAPMTTRKDQVHGTVLYMSPEQLQGRPVTPVSDIYAFGTVLYEALAGVHPCLIGCQEVSLGALAYQHLTVIPPPVEEFTQEVPRDLSRIIDRCISKKASERYPTMKAVVEALSAWWARRQQDPALGSKPPRDLDGTAATGAGGFSPVPTDRRILGQNPGDADTDARTTPWQRPMDTIRLRDSEPVPPMPGLPLKESAPVGASVPRMPNEPLTESATVTAWVPAAPRNTRRIRLLLRWMLVVAGGSLAALLIIGGLRSAGRSASEPAVAGAAAPSAAVSKQPAVAGVAAPSATATATVARSGNASAAPENGSGASPGVEPTESSRPAPRPARTRPKPRQPDKMDAKLKALEAEIPEDRTQPERSKADEYERRLLDAVP